MLAKLEEKFGEPVGRRFDLICGTSVGGIIALAVALEIPMQDVVDLFVKKGADIFHAKETWRSKIRQIFKSKHQSLALEKALSDTFVENILGNALHPALIPSINYSKGAPQVFKTPHNQKFERDWQIGVVDIALATSAAPVVLPLHKIEGRGVYADGGLYANAPGLLGLHEAQHFMNVALEQIHILSIGTMSSELTLSSDRKLEQGLINIPCARGWGIDLLNLMMSSQEALTHNLLKQQLAERYYQIDVSPTKDQDADLALDLASSAAIETLTFRADDSYQVAIGDPMFSPFINHHAASPEFWYGPNANMR